ncbi:MAG: hypothetical protein HC900_11355 [Methylacidiphilales bacterium]|nr:hypothetical protein [Candidatus Methylacidiphilales bacterium]
MLQLVISAGVFAVFLANTLVAIHYIFLCLRDGVAQAYGPIGSDEFALWRDERPVAYWAFVALIALIAAGMAALSYDSLRTLIAS